MDERAVQDAFGRSAAPRLVSVNKVNAAPAERLRWAEGALDARAFPVSALHFWERVGARSASPTSVFAGSKS